MQSFVDDSREMTSTHFQNPNRLSQVSDYRSRTAAGGRRPRKMVGFRNTDPSRHAESQEEGSVVSDFQIEANTMKSTQLSNHRFSTTHSPDAASQSGPHSSIKSGGRRLKGIKHKSKPFEKSAAMVHSMKVINPDSFVCTMSMPNKEKVQFEDRIQYNRLSPNLLLSNQGQSALPITKKNDIEKVIVDRSKKIGARTKKSHLNSDNQNDSIGERSHFRNSFDMQ